MERNATYDIAAGIVLFNPNAKELESSIQAIQNQVSRIYLIDNTPISVGQTSFNLPSNAIIVRNNNNLGIAKALNQIMEQAAEDGFEWVLTLDQDSVFPSDGISAYEAVFADIVEDKNNLGMICPVFTNRSSGNITGKTGYVDDCITSGALVSVRAWKEVGGYNEDYFIDLVDFEFCARLNEAGYRIYQTEAVNLSHQLGYPKQITLFGRAIGSNNYPPPALLLPDAKLLYLQESLSEEKPQPQSVKTSCVRVARR